VFANVDAMVEPVLTPAEAAASPHFVARLAPLAAHRLPWGGVPAPIRVVRAGPVDAPECAPVVDTTTMTIPRGSAARDLLLPPAVGENDQQPFLPRSRL